MRGMLKQVKSTLGRPYGAVMLSLNRAWKRLSYKKECIRGIHAINILVREGLPDWRDIPVVINNRNRLTYMQQQIDWLEDVGCRKIILLDNDSTYPPLLAYYARTPHRVIRTGRNLGYMALWRSGLFTEIRKSFFIYTDPDVVPDPACPKDAIAMFYEALVQHRVFNKVGFSLRIDDLPQHNNAREDVMLWEKRFWAEEFDERFYRAGIDTTFAVYRPWGTSRRPPLNPCLRSKPPYAARHLPWYEDSANLTEEQRYYYDHIAPETSWWGLHGSTARQRLLRKLRESEQTAAAKK